MTNSRNGAHIERSRQVQPRSLAEILAEDPQAPTFARWPHGNLNLGESEDAGWLSAAFGVQPDGWQQTCLDLILARRKVARSDRYAADRVGVAISRQNGKNAVLTMVELVKLVDRGRRVVHTAHEVKTAAEAFRRLAALFAPTSPFKDLREMTSRIRYANGQEAIELVNGAEIRFIARTKGSGRGFTADDLILDEAQELGEGELSALMPIISSAPSRDPQIIMVGTPPSPDMDGAVFTRLREEARAGASQRVGWVEWSIPAPPLGLALDLDDRELWARANPALPDRITWAAVENERALMDDAGFARERLGMWAASESVEAIPAELWANGATNRPPDGQDPRRAFAVDMTPDRMRAAVAVAVEAGEAVHVELTRVFDTSGGTGELLAYLTDRGLRRWPIIIDAYSPAASLVTDLRSARMKVEITTGRQLTDACGLFMDLLRGTQLTHFNQAALNKAVRIATKRVFRDGGGWAWNRRQPDQDISPLMAVTLAAWGLITHRRGRRTTNGTTAGEVTREDT